MAYAHHTYVLEVFSGLGSVSETMHKMLKCPVETIDVNAEVHPTMCMDVLQWSCEASGLQQKYPQKHPIIFASPPCEHYSRMRTTSPRDLEMADRHVDAVRKISEDLDAVLVFIENPATGLLKTRDVINFLPYSYTVDYCQYGFLYKKSTMIWCNKELEGFQAKRCPGDACASVFEDVLGGKRYRHVYEYNGMPLDQRQRVPDQLVVSLLKHALPHLTEALSPAERKDKKPRTAVARDNYEVDYILAVRYDEENEVVMVKLQWKGYDTPSWIKATDLSVPLDEYDYISNEVRKRALEMMA